MKHVLVTGANGHVGYNIVQLLREKGYQVRAGVRDTARADALRALGAEPVQADIMDPAALTAAVRGVDGVFQVAAVYKVTARDPQTEIIEPSSTGGLNVLRAAKAAGVRRVVFTSSVAAVGAGTRGEDRALTEDDWNLNAKNPYSYAKTAAEQAARDYANQNDLELVCINPSAVIGPGFFRHTPSTILFEMLLRKRLPFIMPFTLTFVDARDVAAAHVLAFENSTANGRYICADYNTDLADLMKLFHEIDPTLKVPNKMLPDFLLRTAPLVDWLGHKFTGTPRAVTADTIREMAHNPVRYDSERLRRELGWQPRPIKASLVDTLDWVRAQFLR